MYYYITFVTYLKYCNYVLVTNGQTEGHNGDGYNVSKLMFRNLKHVKNNWCNGLFRIYFIHAMIVC